MRGEGEKGQAGHWYCVCVSFTHIRFSGSPAQGRSLCDRGGRGDSESGTAPAQDASLCRAAVSRRPLWARPDCGKRRVILQLNYYKTPTKIAEYMDFSLLDRLEMRHPEEFDVIRVNLERRRISPKNEYGGIGIAFSRVGSSFVIMQLTAGGSAARSLQVIFACIILISSIHHFVFGVIYFPDQNRRCHQRNRHNR